MESQGSPAMPGAIIRLSVGLYVTIPATLPATSRVPPAQRIPVHGAILLPLETDSGASHRVVDELCAVVSLVALAVHRFYCVGEPARRIEDLAPNQPEWSSAASTPAGKLVLAEMVGTDRFRAFSILGSHPAADTADAEVGIADDACHRGLAAPPGRPGRL